MRHTAAGALLTGLSWMLSAHAGSRTTLYLTHGVLGGIGIVYVGVVGQMVGWFPDRRDFAAGIVAAGYGMGAIVTTFPIASSIASVGYQATLLQHGAVFGAVGFLAALGLQAPPAAAQDEVGVRVDIAADIGTNTSTAMMLKTPVFWLMFAMMTLMATSGLMVISQMANVATEFGVAKLTAWGAAALPLALTIDRFTNGLTRPFFGFVSDRIGRENAMFLAFALEAASMAAWLASSGDPVLFVLLSGVVFFGWGEIFSLFPATLTDTFGSRNATRNYGCL